MFAKCSVINFNGEEHCKIFYIVEKTCINLSLLTDFRTSKLHQKMPRRCNSSMQEVYNKEQPQAKSRRRRHNRKRKLNWGNTKCRCGKSHSSPLWSMHDLPFWIFAFFWLCKDMQFFKFSSLFMLIKDNMNLTWSTELMGKILNE